MSMRGQCAAGEDAFICIVAARDAHLIKVHCDFSVWINCLLNITKPECGRI